MRNYRVKNQWDDRNEECGMTVTEQETIDPGDHNRLFETKYEILTKILLE